MSGGAYNYLYCRLGDGNSPDLLGMLERLEELGYTEAAGELRRFVVPEPSEELVTLVRAVEWFDSDDYSHEQADAANLAYLEAQVPQGG